MTLTKSAMTITSLSTALLFGGGLYLFMNFGSIAKQVTESYASKTLGVNVSIGRMAVSFKDRTVDVTNVRVDNPPGYKTPHALTVGAIHIQAGALGSDLLELKDVSVKNADVYLEIKTDGTNLTDIRKNLNENVGSNPSEGEQAIKVILDKLVMEGTIHPSISFLDREIKVFSLPPITVTGIGSGNNGVYAGAAISKIWKVVTEESVKAAQDEGLFEGISSDVLKDAGLNQVEIFKGKLDSEVDNLKDGLKKIFE